MTNEKVKKKLPVKIQNEYLVDIKALNAKPHENISFEFNNGETYSLSIDKLEKTLESETSIKEYSVETVVLISCLVMLVLLTLYAAITQTDK